MHVSSELHSIRDEIREAVSDLTIRAAIARDRLETALAFIKAQRQPEALHLIHDIEHAMEGFDEILDSNRIYAPSGRLAYAIQENLGAIKTIDRQRETVQ